MAAAAPQERQVLIPWARDPNDSEDGSDDDEGSQRRAIAQLTTEEQRLFMAASSYFPPHITVSTRWLVDLVRSRRCAQCGEMYRDVDNYSLRCRTGTHVLDINRSIYYSVEDTRPLWECCLRPGGMQFSGCVAADHTEDARMRRHRPDSELYSAFPSCMWYAVEHDNRSVLMSADAPTKPSDEDVRRAYEDDPAARVPGSVATVVLLRYDWREARKRREEAQGRALERVRKRCMSGPVNT